MSKTDRITISYVGAIAHVALNRPEKRNALDMAMLEAIVETCETLTNAREIRAVVLSGAGQAFCAGLDFMSFAGMLQNPDSLDFQTRTHGNANLFQQAAMGWKNLPMPVIAALHGVAFGGGFQIMLGADIRVATPDTRFSIMEAKWGLVPDMGGMALMPALARQDIIRRLTYTAEVFEADNALNWGFITEIADTPLTRALDIAKHIAARSPDAMRAAKKLITDTWNAPVDKVLMAESAAQKTVLGQENQREAVLANLENRPPDFKD
ncbi:MAG: crotonase/enoyl-CoA hydratase family protein [Paracoccaceae bacterium]